MKSITAALIKQPFCFFLNNGYYMIYGPPTVGLYMDEGTHIAPYLNLGFKIGFGWNGK
jgi:hypothetical protein